MDFCFDEDGEYSLVETISFDKPAVGYNAISEAYVSEGKISKGVLYIELRKDILGLSDMTGDISEKIEELENVKKVFWADSGYFAIDYKNKEDLSLLLYNVDDIASDIMKL
jgi:hypothetical protein|tara:strand:- start:2089 stop:2421 length:333 start_codon:yes stop_codon:yes gene_type:complete